MKPAVCFYVPGKPGTAGSKKAFPIRRGGVFVRNIIVDDSGAAGKAWRSSVQDRARGACGSPMLDCPIKLTTTFLVQRPKYHYGKHGLKPNAPKYPTTKPDCTKMLRAVEDALKGIVWRDDSQVVIQNNRKEYSDMPGCHVEISEVES